MSNNNPWNTTIPVQSLLSPDTSFRNSYGNDVFIVNRLASKRFSLKPNLKSKPLIYRGQKQHYELIRSSFDRCDNLSDKIVSNLRAEEFIRMLQTHPLFMLFERGIKLDGFDEPFFLDMNYYGLAQHYNFNTGLVDFTSDINAAAFFATTLNHGDDVYEPYGGNARNPVGVVYIHEIKPMATFKALGFTTIGQQVYPRSGAQSGFLYNEGMSVFPVEKLVVPVYFRHDIDCARTLFDKLDKGKALFPDDDLSIVAREILHSDRISGATFTENLYTNHDRIEYNLKLIREKGIDIDWGLKRIFTKDLLSGFYSSGFGENWIKFCNRIAFNDPNEKQLMESLLNLPRHPCYRQYFSDGYFERLQYFSLASQQRASQNSRRKSTLNLQS